MRRPLVSVLVAIAGAAGVVAVGWALQAEALPPPRPAARVAANATVWLHDYRLAVDIFHFHHRRVEGACVRGWIGTHKGAKVRGALLSFESGPIVRILGRAHGSVVKERRRRGFPPALLAAEAGCTGRLALTLVTAVQNSAHLSTEQAYAANRPAVALELQQGKGGRLTLFVSPRTDRPLVAFVDRGRRHITARIYLAPVRRRVLRQFQLLHRLKPEPKK